MPCGLVVWRLFGVHDECVVVEPHVTLVHPRTTNRGSSAWANLAGMALAGEMTVMDTAITAFDGRAWPVVARFALSDQAVDGPRRSPSRDQLGGR